ncbi:MAG: hypothetical protein BWX73_01848 [Lentisphaerae bacterium ADurb.Bin082]|nr:MAG: hypothetical protein BWX73_01848 [Lentisphaerae bacterium ADurb.Bin082]
MKKTVALLLTIAMLLSSLLTLAQEGSFDWSKAVELHPGIRHAKMTVETPRLMQINVARVDLDTPGLRLRATGRDADWGKPMPDFPEQNINTRRQKTRDFIRQARRPADDGGFGLNMVFAVNSNPWIPWQKPFSHKYAAKLGLVISEGELVSDPNGRPSLIIRQDGTADLITTNAETNLTGIVTAVSGFTFVLQDGNVIKGNQSLAPRTGYGLTADKRVLLIVVIDGRQPQYSQGSTTGEVGEWLRHLGAQTGVNMDGGGSTTMAVWKPAGADGEPEAVVQLNRHQGGAERTVGCNLGFYYLPTAP